MTTTIISNNSPHTYGMMTNQAVGKLISLQTSMERLNDAIATASSGYAGEHGTEFEGPSGLFGVQASGTPGEQGAAYSYAVLQLYDKWKTFWTEAEPFIEQLDNGTFSM